MSWHLRVAIYVALAAAAAAAVALLAVALGAGYAGAALALALVSASGGFAVARFAREPLDRLQNWLGSPERLASRLDESPEWSDIAFLLERRLTEARQAVGASRQELEQLRSVLSTMADGVIVADSRSRIRLMNRAAEGMFGLPSGGGDGRTVIEATVNAPLDAAFLMALTDGLVESRDIDILLPVPLRVRAVVNATGGPSAERSAVAVLHDLTEATKLDRVRRDFVANVSHELRTPVAGIQSMAESLLSGALTDEDLSRRFLANISNSADRLVHLVDDLLQLARSESGLPANRSAVPLGPIARDVVASLDAAITAAGLDVGVEVDDDVCVWGDPESVRQILSNLVDNAVKYTAPGGSVDVRASVGRTGGVTMEVADTGIGIPRESLGRVFERFFRVDPARSRELGGTGLGLSIVRHLTESLGGEVGVESEPGRGTTFRVRLPEAQLPRSPA